MKRSISNQVVFGVIIVIFGILLLVNNLGLAETSALWRWIPTLFILLGIYQLVVNGFEYWVGPIILIFGGGMFQMAALGIISWGNVWASIFPIVLILIGVRIVLRRSGVNFPGIQSETSSDDRLNLFVAFSGTDKRVISEQFTGGEVVSILGGSDVDLRDAKIASKPAVMHLTTIFGGTDIMVPTHWNVQMDIVPLFGGSSDERRGVLSPTDPTPDLILKGVVMFGGITLKN